MNTDALQQQKDAADTADTADTDTAKRRVPRDWVSEADLEAMGIVENWQTLRAWQKDPAIGFPLGRLLGPNSRRWHWQTEIAPWLASRPTAIRVIAANKRRKKKKKAAAARARSAVA
jgi:hypothetical protein